MGDIEGGGEMWQYEGFNRGREVNKYTVNINVRPALLPGQEG